MRLASCFISTSLNTTKAAQLCHIQLDTR